MKTVDVLVRVTLRLKDDTENIEHLFLDLPTKDIKVYVDGESQYNTVLEYETVDVCEVSKSDDVVRDFDRIKTLLGDRESIMTPEEKY